MAMATGRKLIMTTMIKLKTKRCIHCGETGIIEMPQSDFERGAALYEAGAYIQDAFPNLNATQREQIISGTHPKCWDEIFADHSE